MPEIISFARCRSITLCRGKPAKYCFRRSAQKKSFTRTNKLSGLVRITSVDVSFTPRRSGSWRGMADRNDTNLEGAELRRNGTVMAASDVNDWLVREVLPLEAMLMQFLRRGWRKAPI
jgi:hypothetical protein